MKKSLQEINMQDNYWLNPAKKFLAFFLPLTWIGILFAIFYEAEILRDVDKAIAENDIVSIAVCDKELDELNSILKSLKLRKGTKSSGSSPIAFYELTIVSSINKYQFYLGLDSRDRNLFWLYEYEEPRFKTELAFIRSKNLSKHIEECSPVISGWVYDRYIYWQFGSVKQ